MNAYYEELDEILQKKVDAVETEETQNEDDTNEKQFVELYINVVTLFESMVIYFCILVFSYFLTNYLVNVI